ASTYTITGALPNSPILWSSWKNGTGTGEADSSYGQITDSSGSWVGVDGAWSASDAGLWTKMARVSCAVANVNFNVSTTLTPGPPTAAVQMIGVTDWGASFDLTSEPLPVEDAKLVQNLNSKTIFVSMSPKALNGGDYPGTNFGTVNNLKDLAMSA